MSDCLFCKLVDGTIPATKVYEDEYVLAFMDIMPLTKGHTLLIPKAHHDSILELSSELAAHFFSVAPKIAQAIDKAFAPSGINLLNNNGAPAGQSVFHYHMHFIPRYDVTDGLKVSWMTKEKQYTFDDFAEFAKKIQEQLK